MLAATFGKRDRDVLASSAGASNRSWMGDRLMTTESSLLAGIIGALLVSLWATEPCLSEAGPSGGKSQRRGRERARSAFPGNPHQVRVQQGPSPDWPMSALVTVRFAKRRCDSRLSRNGKAVRRMPRFRGRHPQADDRWGGDLGRLAAHYGRSHLNRRLPAWTGQSPILGSKLTIELGPTAMLGHDQISCRHPRATALQSGWNRHGRRGRRNHSCSRSRRRSMHGRGFPCRTRLGCE